MRNRRVARLIAATYELHRDRKKRSEAFTENDFMPKLDPRFRPDDGRWIEVAGKRVAHSTQTVADQVAIMRSWAMTIPVLKGDANGRR